MGNDAKIGLTGHPSLIANRYRVEEILGQGGMAVVYQVADTATGKKLALKQLLVKKEDENQQDIAQLFEHEFHTLVQLAHPRVIAVYDYGKDEAGAYYTMELLDGGDLRELAPVPWKKACSLLSDVCSALGLLHSRRQIHRDLTPRNVRCTRDGKAKLIDFGAMTPMGPCKQVVGTPAFTAPEVVTLQALDGRADLYSLGATLYYALTGGHAYPAKNFDDLRDMWRSKPRPPSSYAKDIPKELDNLVLSLLNLDAVARPANAAEVMDRLSAIADLEVDEQLLVSRAYLSAPVLVGREEPLASVRKQMIRALRGRGGATLIEGASGVGRSRFLDACVLDGKLSGAVVLRADASDAHAGAWGAVKALASQLADALPEAAWQAARPHVRLLGNILPELLERFGDGARPSFRPSQTPRARQAVSGDPGTVPDPSAEVWGGGHSWRPPPPAGDSSIPPETLANPQEVRPRMQAALLKWFLEIAEHRCLLVAVDDAHRIDEPSAAFLALLAHEAYDRMILVAVTAETDAPAVSPAAMKLLRQTGAGIKLRNLGLEQTEQMLGSMFGETPNLRLLADRLFAISQGNPAAVMQLTRHLVDRGLIHYQSGAWTLPDKIDAGDLPGSLSEALKARMQKLGDEARELARTLALSPERRFNFKECLFLSASPDAARLVQNLDELIASEVLTTDGEYYWLSQQGWVSVLRSDLDKDAERALHLKLAEMLDRRGTVDFRVAQHLLRAGEEERALEVFLAQGQETRQRLGQNPAEFSDYIQSLPEDWIDTMETLLRVCQRLGKPKEQSFWARQSLVSLSAVSVASNKSHLIALIQQLYHDSGLDCYRELGDSVQGPDRLFRALEMAQQRYDATPESERVLAPSEAIRELAQAIIIAISVVGTSFDYPLIESVPSLAPLFPLSAALEIVEKNVRATANLAAARNEQARAGYLEVLDRLAQPDRAGVDESYYEYTRLTVMYAIGMIEASLGLRSALKWADDMESHPLFQVNAWRIRMVYNLSRGDTRRAEQCKKRLELLQIRNSPSQFFEGVQLYPEVRVYCLSDDLTGVKQTIDGIEKMAERFETWKPILHFARGEYQRIRGDYAAAISELETALQLTAAGRHIVWPFPAGSYILTLLESGRLAEAKEAGHKLLDAAEKADLGISCNHIKRVLALAEAKLGEYESAVSLLEADIAQYHAADVQGINLGIAYETRARVAVMMNDYESFTTYARLCAEQFQAGHNPALTAKYEKLIQEARQARLGVSDDLARAAEFSELGSSTGLSLAAAMLTGCKGPRERAERALELLVNQSNCSGGFLYTMQKEGPVLSAQNGNRPPPLEMDAMVSDFLAAELEEAEEVTIRKGDFDAASDQTVEWTGRQEERYRPLLLGHNTQDGFAVTGLAVLLLSPGKLFNFPRETVAAVSKSLLDAGDVATVYTL